MGCDIHIHVEALKDGVWRNVGWAIGSVATWYHAFGPWLPPGGGS